MPSDFRSARFSNSLMQLIVILGRVVTIACYFALQRDETREMREHATRPQDILKSWSITESEIMLEVS